MGDPMKFLADLQSALRDAEAQLEAGAKDMEALSKARQDAERQIAVLVDAAQKVVQRIRDDMGSALDEGPVLTDLMQDTRNLRDVLSGLPAAATETVELEPELERRLEDMKGVRDQYRDQFRAERAAKEQAEGALDVMKKLCDEARAQRDRAWAALNKAEAERDRCRSMIRHCEICGDSWVDDGLSTECSCIGYNRLRAKNERLREVLDTYGEHKATCSIHQRRPDERGACSCGLDNVLQGGKEQDDIERHPQYGTPLPEPADSSDAGGGVDAVCPHCGEYGNTFWRSRCREAVRMLNRCSSVGSVVLAEERIAFLARPEIQALLREEDG